ncbi:MULTISPECIES: glycosyltransferase [Saccharothrix]|uniref:glycosyltransferase n=1 Tax=Saccharothrix TaxID=2071 RepID=UPI0009681CDA|nr:glycosyltransferase [Saccharothrix sp. CB00851]OKI18217.1 hypothetical protein A6A25_11680 [Saccharothrix sp. CB00851]
MTVPRTIRVAIVLYRNPLGEIWRCVRAINRAAELAIARTGLGSVAIAIGDCSDQPLVNDAEADNLRSSVAEGVTLDYRWFGANLGHSAGSNALAEDATEDAVLFLNPDSYVAPTLLLHLLDSFRDPGVAAVDARQVPCEHPKHFDPRTGDQSWASGACVLVRTPAFHAVGGFDAEWFPSYVNDVDLSWRIRLRGDRVVHQPRAVVFHDKRLDADAHVRTTAIEPYAGILGRLVLATRYGRPDIVTETIDVMRVHGSDEQRRALEEFERRRAADRLPAPVPADGVAEFIDGEYGRRRF